MIIQIHSKFDCFKSYVNNKWEIKWIVLVILILCSNSILLKFLSSQKKQLIILIFRSNSILLKFLSPQKKQLIILIFYFNSTPLNFLSPKKKRVNTKS